MVWFLPEFRKAPTFQSPLNGKITVKKRYGKKAVLTGEITQSGGEIYPMWEKVLRELKDKKYPGQDALILGVGGGSAIELLNRYFPKVKMTGVELDPVMLQIATTEFGLDEIPHLKLIEADAIAYLSHDKKQYDLLLVDLYIGKLNPQKSREDAFLREIKKHLNKKGLLLYNAHYQGEKEHQELLVRLQKHFHTIEEVFSYPLNRVLFLQ